MTDGGNEAFDIHSDGYAQQVELDDLIGATMNQIRDALYDAIEASPKIAEQLAERNGGALIASDVLNLFVSSVTYGTTGLYFDEQFQIERKIPSDLHDLLATSLQNLGLAGSRTNRVGYLGRTSKKYKSYGTPKKISI